MSASTNGESSRTPRPRRIRPALRQASIILPKTGERVHRTFTLQTPPNEDIDSEPHDRTPLLGYIRNRRQRSTLRNGRGTPPANALELLKEAAVFGYDLVSSPHGRAVLKCSLAYVLGSLATLVPGISGLLGHNDGKHMVATVVVYFHPARNAGSMLEACALAIGAFLYALLIASTSMAVSVFFGSHNLLTVGYILILIVFCGGSLGLIGWTKQRLVNPLVNVACSLASLAIIIILTKEDAVHSAKFSYEKVYQVLKMILMGVFISSVVGLIIKPQSARKELREDLVRITDLLEEVLTFITRGFLSGSDQDCNNNIFEAAQKRYNSNFNSLVKNLREARFEHYVLGTEKIHKLEVKLVKCIERLSQDLVGLRSAASTQFALISKSDDGTLPLLDDSLMFSPSQLSDMGRWGARPSTGLESIEEVSEGTPNSEIDQGNGGMFSQMSMTMSAAELFSLFISQLGPPMKSLAFTLKGVLNDLPFGPAPKYEITFNSNFAHSLCDAKELFISARHNALDTLYTQRITIKDRSPDVDADIEEVAASCGHFSSCLEDFAEDTVAYLEVLQDLKTVLCDKEFRRSWKWMLFWRKKSSSEQQMRNDEEDLVRSENETTSRRIPSPHHITRPQQHKVIKYRNNDSLSYRIWRSTSILRREDVKYAIKVGLGAILYAMFSFIPSTRPIYARWRGEWGLLSYMLVCSMTIGASNTTGLQRFIGTCVGAALAIFAWFISGANAIVLGVLGWFVSLGCFTIILIFGKGPMGRFILLTYNLSALYAYSLSVKDGEDDEDEGGRSPEIWGIVLHRVVAVLAGCLWGVIVTRLVWPISARKKVKDGIALLWLRMGLIWKRDPLQMLVDGSTGANYMDIRESIELRRYLTQLEGLRSSATHEFDLRGPFPDKLYREILESSGRMLGAFHAMQVAISKDLKATVGEAELLKHTKAERMQLSARISHLFSVLASSMKLEYPMNDALPNITHSRDRFLAKLFAYRKQVDQIAKDDDYELLYTYGLVTGQIAGELEGVGRCIEQLYGVLNEDSLKLQIDVAIRLRRAIHLNDPLLVKRIITSNPDALRNPDFRDKSNTSLHLAAQLGCEEIARLLIDAGHEDEGISLNTQFETPLMLACEAKQAEVGRLLIAAFPRCVPWTNKQGMDALMLTARNGTLPLLSLLLQSGSTPTAFDKDGNTALHYASASGELKALRLLLQYGASPLAQNAYSWTPIAYSATSAAEAYFKQLVAEFERRRVEVVQAHRELEKQRVAGVRLVTNPGGDGRVDDGSTTGGARSASAMGFREGPSGAPQIGMDWSPVTPLERKAMTPTEGMGGPSSGWPLTSPGTISSRGRAGSGD